MALALASSVVSAWDMGDTGGLATTLLWLDMGCRGSTAPTSTTRGTAPSVWVSACAPPTITRITRIIRIIRTIRPDTTDTGGYGHAGYGYGYGGVYANGELRLKVKPRHAQVFVDGYFVGNVDSFDGVFQSLRLEEGTYQIEILAPGYEPLILDVRILPGEKIVYEGVLVPLP